jgi:hypothetical protein
MIPQVSADQYAVARRKALYLPESDCLLLYATWIMNKELQNKIMYLELLAVDTTGDTNIEDRMLIIVARLDNMRRNFPSLQAFLPSEFQWVFHFSFSYIFPKLLGQGTVRRTSRKRKCKILKRAGDYSKKKKYTPRTPKQGGSTA